MFIVVVVVLVVVVVDHECLQTCNGSDDDD